MRILITYLVLLTVSILHVSCNNKSTGPNGENTSFTIVKAAEEKVDSISRIDSDSQEFPNEVMKQSEILFNGKLGKYFSYSDFKKHFGLADSTKKLIEKTFYQVLTPINPICSLLNSKKNFFLMDSLNFTLRIKELIRSTGGFLVDFGFRISDF